MAPFLWLWHGNLWLTHAQGKLLRANGVAPGCEITSGKRGVAPPQRTSIWRLLKANRNLHAGLYKPNNRTTALVPCLTLQGGCGFENDYLIKENENGFQGNPGRRNIGP